MVFESRPSFLIFIPWRPTRSISLFHSLTAFEALSSFPFLDGLRGASHFSTQRWPSRRFFLFHSLAAFEVHSFSPFLDGLSGASLFQFIDSLQSAFLFSFLGGLRFASLFLSFTFQFNDGLRGAFHFFILRRRSRRIPLFHSLTAFETLSSFPLLVSLRGASHFSIHRWPSKHVSFSFFDGFRSASFFFIPWLRGAFISIPWRPSRRIPLFHS